MKMIDKALGRTSPVENFEARLSRCRSQESRTSGDWTALRADIHRMLIDGSPVGDVAAARAKLPAVERAMKEAQEETKAAEEALSNARCNAEEKRRKEEIAEAEAHLQKSVKDGAKSIAAGLAMVAEGFRLMADEREAAKRAYTGGPWPHGSLCDLSSLRFAIEREIYRLSGDPVNTARTLPGGDAHDFRLVGQPNAIPSLVDVIEQANAFVLSALEAKSHTTDERVHTPSLSSEGA